MTARNAPDRVFSQYASALNGLRSIHGSPTIVVRQKEKEPLMEHNRAAAMRTQIAAYVNHDMTFEEFADWYVGLPVEAIDAGEDIQAKELLYEIQLRFAQLEDGLWNEVQFRRLLAPLTQPGVIAVLDPQVALGQRAFAAPLEMAAGSPSTSTDVVIQVATSLPSTESTQGSVRITSDVGTLTLS
ncbi:MAG: hypothetical protein M1396_00600 [Chloroflexi bacterium]|nr:hypothetical protein [Chloroflexota bacterium]